MKLILNIKELEEFQDEIETNNNRPDVNDICIFVDTIKELWIERDKLRADTSWATTAGVCT